MKGRGTEERATAMKGVRNILSSLSSISLIRLLPYSGYKD
jgi:hypothetical protein